MKAPKILREYQRLTQVAAAEKMGITPAYISVVEAGHKRVTLYFIECLAEAYDVPVWSIFYLEDVLNGKAKRNKILPKKILKILDYEEER